MPETIYEMSKRLCDSTSCADCPLKEIKGEICLISLIKERKVEKIAEQLELLREWAEEHPIKPYKDVLWEKFPKAVLGAKATFPLICRKALFGEKLHCDNFIGRDYRRCKECWNEPYKEQEDND